MTFHVNVVLPTFFITQSFFQTSLPTLNITTERQQFLKTIKVFRHIAITVLFIVVVYYKLLKQVPISLEYEETLKCELAKKIYRFCCSLITKYERPKSLLGTFKSCQDLCLKSATYSLDRNRKSNCSETFCRAISIILCKMRIADKTAAYSVRNETSLACNS